MRVRSRAGTVAALTTFLIASSPNLAQAQQLPAGISGSASAYQAAIASWSRRTPDHVFRYYAVMMRAGSGWTWLGGHHAYAVVTAHEMKCDLVRGRVRTCSTSRSTSRTLPVQDFNFSPAMDRAQASTRRASLRWTSSAPYGHDIRHRITKPHKLAPPRTLWAAVRAEATAWVTRDEEVHGRIFGKRIPSRSNAIMITGTGTNWDAGACLLEQGGICS